MQEAARHSLGATFKINILYCGGVEWRGQGVAVVVVAVAVVVVV